MSLDSERMRVPANQKMRATVRALVGCWADTRCAAVQGRWSVADGGWTGNLEWVKGTGGVGARARVRELVWESR